MTRLPSRPCGWCKKDFSPHIKQPGQQFCSRQCQQAWGKLQVKRGRQLVSLMLRRKAKARGCQVSGKVPTYNEIDWLVQGWHMEDREAGRLHLYDDKPLMITHQIAGAPPSDIPEEME